MLDYQTKSMLIILIFLLGFLIVGAIFSCLESKKEPKYITPSILQQKIEEIEKFENVESVSLEIIFTLVVPFMAYDIETR